MIFIANDVLVPPKPLAPLCLPVSPGMVLLYCARWQGTDHPGVGFPCEQC